MLAYNKTTLRNLAIHEQIEEAVHHKLLSAEKEKELKLAYPVDLYTPNFFVRIGLGILTIFIVLASVGLLALITGFDHAGIFLMFAGLVCYGFLEMMVLSKKHYNSGVDNILMIGVIILITAAIMDILPYNVNEEVTTSLCVFIISLYFTIRFADSMMSVCCSIAFFLYLFYSVSTLGVVARQVVPFIIIAASGFIYFVAQRIAKSKSAFHYLFTLKAVAVVALASLYIAGNYFIVRELSIEVFRLDLNKNGNISMAWFFWTWTMLIPVVYIVVGLKKRDLVFIRLGIILCVFSVLTFRYYHAILPAEAAMLLAGTLIILVTYALIKYLQKPHYGFTFEETNKKNPNALNLEGVIIGEAFGNKIAPQQQDTTFGGGSFGGAGAGGSY